MYYRTYFNGRRDDSFFIGISPHASIPLYFYCCKMRGSNWAVSMKLYLKSVQMRVPRTSERWKKKIHRDVNVSLMARDEMGQDK